MGKLNINNGGVDTNKKMADIDERFGPYTSIEAADSALGGQGRNTITAGLTVGILTANAGVKEYWYQPNKKTGLLELIPKGGNAADDPTEGNFASFDSNGNVKDSGCNKGTFIKGVQKNGTDLTPDANGKVNVTVQDGVTPHIDQTTKHWMIGEEDTNVDAEGKSAYQVYVASVPQGETPMTEPQWLASLKGDKGDNAISPFKGWLNATSDLPANPHVGDYAYIEDNGTTYVYRCITEGSWPTTSSEEKEPSSAAFASAQLLNNVRIDDTHLSNPIGSDEDNNPTLANAEDVMQLKAKLEGVTASEEKVINYTLQVGVLNANTKEFIGTEGAARYTVIPVGDAKRVRFLGVSYGDANTSYNYGFGFYNSSDEIFGAKRYEGRNDGGNKVTKEYVVDIPDGAVSLICSVILANNTLNESNFYCYLKGGTNVVEMIPEVDQTQLDNPDDNSVAKAKDVMQLKAKLNDVTFSEAKIEGSVESGKAVSGNDGHIVDSTNGKMYAIPIPNGLKSVKFLGWDMVSDSNVNNYGWCFGKKVDEETSAFYNNWNQIQWHKFDHNQSTDFAPKEYTDTVPSGATWLLITLKTAYIPKLENPYCYGQTGDSITDLIPEVVNDLDSDATDKSLSAAQGKTLDEKKQNKTVNEYTYESVEATSVQNIYIAHDHFTSSDAYRTSFFPAEAGKTYRLTGKYRENAPGSFLIAYANNGTFIESHYVGTGYAGQVRTVEVTVPSNINANQIVVEYAGTSALATCEEKVATQFTIEERLEDLKEANYENSEYIAQDKTAKEINILCLGNSFTEDTMSYVPYLLAESGIKGYTFNIYMTYISGASLADYKEYVEGGTPASEKNPKLHVSTNGSPWASQSLPSFLELIAMKNWDLVTIQQGGSINYTSYDTNFKPYINAICQQIQRKANTGVKIGYIMSHASYVNTTDTLSFDTETTRLQERFEGTNEYPGIAANARRVMEETPVSILLPYGTAVQNLRTASYLNELGTKGHLSHDHIHLTDGLPCLVAAYANALTILSYCIGDKTILSSPINPIRAWLTEKNVPSSTNGPVGLTAYNRRVAQTCAMLAIKKPFEISDIKQIGLIGDYKVSLMNTTNYDFNNPILSANNGESWSIKLTANEGYSIQSVEVTMGGSIVSDAYDTTTGIVYISNVTGNIVITPTLTQI